MTKKELLEKTSRQLLGFYNTVMNSSDDQEREEARRKFKRIEEKVNAEGEMFKTIFGLVYQQIRRGNTYINISEPFIYSGKEADLIDAFRVYGIELFTFSSEWSNAGRSAYEFAKKGATVEDIILVYNGNEDINGQKEKTPAYIFRVN